MKTIWRKRVAVVAVAGMGSGCATIERSHTDKLKTMMLAPEVIELAKKEGEVELADDSRIVCRKEMPTGSHMAKWRCETIAGKASRERANQQRMRERVFRSKPKLGSE